LQANNGVALGDLETVMREAGELARATARGPFKRWTKGEDKSPVSDGDIAVNDFLRAHLSRLSPQAGWLSEETEDDLSARAAPTAWIVDPIDGTRAYVAGFPDWSISVALVEGGRPLIAALYAPVTEEMFLGRRGGGATLNASSIGASSGIALDGARLAGPKRYLTHIATINPGIRAEPKVHSLALRLARVAQGEFDAAFASQGGNDWDLAAADLLVHEAGGVMTDFAGRTLTYNRPHTVHGALIAAGRARHGTLIDLVRDRQSEFA
jgi:myo-inositol-1(or 4)-monophosphatase